MRGVPASLVIPLAVLTFAVPQAHGQATSATSGASVDAGVRVGRLRGTTEAFWGGAALVHPSERLSIGGGGWLLMGRSTVATAGLGSDLELTFGYGGAVIDVLLHESSATRVSVRALLGAGNAKVLVPVVGSEIGADNFGVVEPSLDVSRALAGWLSVKAAASFRFVYAVEDLHQVLSSDLQGVSLSVSFGVHRR